MLWLSAVALLLVCATSHKITWETRFISKFEEIEHSVHFKAWAKYFKKDYQNIAEESHRFLVWLDNWRMIIRHNMKSDETYLMRMNQFGDLTADEFSHYVHGSKGSCLKQRPDSAILSTFNDRITLDKDLINSDFVHTDTNVKADSVDWTTKGVVTPVKNQGQCGSCWAFSTTGSLECDYAIKTGTLRSLSEQQLVDCSGSYGNEGCDGGLMDNAFKYVEAEGGLCLESAYPYKAEDGTCKASTCGTKYNANSGYTDVTHKSSTSLETAVTSGCVSVAVEADQSAFQFYSSGILTGTCGTRLDHGVLVVGYGTQGSQEYWKDYDAIRFDGHEQPLVDCSGLYGNGCYGGLVACDFVYDKFYYIPNYDKWDCWEIAYCEPLFFLVLMNIYVALLNLYYFLFGKKKARVYDVYYRTAGGMPVTFEDIKSGVLVNAYRRLRGGMVPDTDENRFRREVRAFIANANRMSLEATVTISLAFIVIAVFGSIIDFTNEINNYQIPVTIAVGIYNVIIITAAILECSGRDENNCFVRLGRLSGRITILVASLALGVQKKWVYLIPVASAGFVMEFVIGIYRLIKDGHCAGCNSSCLRRLLACLSQCLSSCCGCLRRCLLCACFYIESSGDPNVDASGITGAVADSAHQYASVPDNDDNIQA